MSIDISRKRFDADRNYSGVVMQQGRVQLDADWNENVEILHRRERSRTYDTFGVCALPETTPDAFRIEAVGGTLRIGPGRLYVDGLQAENHGADPQLWDPHLAEEIGSEAVDYGQQPYFPEADVEAPLATDPGTHLVYLDVWQRQVNHLIDPELVESAVGVDTTARQQTVWQVKVLADVGDVNCATPGEDIPGWVEETAPSAGRLTTGPLTVPADPDPCLLPPGGGYKGLENHTYRVEIHDPGVPLEPGDPSDPPPAGTATFKWSRDNGVVAAPVVVLPALDRVGVATLGRDEFLRFRDGDWVEVTDNVRELHGRPGFLSKITVDEANSELILETPLPAGVFPTNPDDTTVPARRTRVRRWDQVGLVEDTSGNDIVDLNAAGAAGAIPVPAAGTPIELEAGVVVTFQTPSGGAMRTGDHWVFVGRTVDGTVEELVEEPPAGIHHHYCRLALVHQPNTGEPDVSDCRHPWACDCCCEISVSPGQDVQAAVDGLPAKGGKVCLQVGVHRLREPLLVDGRRNLVIEGCGPGSLLVLDGGDVVEASIHVAGGSRNVGIENLSVYGERSARLVAVHEGSREVTVSRAILANVTDSDVADCVILGACSEVAVDDSRLLGRRGVVQAEASDLTALEAELEALRPQPEPDVDGPDGDDVAGAADADGAADDGAGVAALVAEPAGLQLEPVVDLRVEGNLVLATERGVELRDVRAGLIGRNRIAPALDALDELRRPDEPAAPAGTVDAEPAEATADDTFLEELHEAFDTLVWSEPQDAEVELLGTGVEACVAERLAVEGNTIRAGIGCLLHYSRRASLTGNDLRVQSSGVSTGYAFDLTVEGNRIAVLAQADEDDEPVIDVQTLGQADPLAAAVSLDFTRGARISDNDVTSPSGIVARRASRSSCPLSAGPSLLRVLGITKLWRVVVELGWIIMHIVHMLGDAEEEPAASKAEFERELLEWWVGFLAGGIPPAFLGKVDLTRNRLCVDRFGVLGRQVFTLGGLGLERNRVAGARFTAIEVRPLFSIGLVDRLSGWIRCVLELLIQLLRMLHDALGRFLDGEPIPEDEAGGDNLAAIGVTVVSGFLSLCARICEPAGDAPDDGEEDGDGPAADQLHDALGDLLDGYCWVDDLLDGAYHVSGNTVRGGGTGIRTGIDGTRVADNRVTVDPDNPVGWEVVVLGLLLAEADADPATAALADAMMDLDRDALLAALFASEDPLEAPDTLPSVIGEFSPLVAAGSPLRHWVDGLEDALESGSDVDAAWRDLLAAIWGELRGYGIVLAGGDFRCTGNRVDAAEVCFGLGRGFGFDGVGFRIAAAPELGDSNFGGLAGGGACAVGGIWQVSNLAGWLLDFARLVGKEQDQDASVDHLLFSFVLLVALLAEKNRRTEVTDSTIRRALTHGIRTRSVTGTALVELSGNDVLDAGRVGVLFKGEDGIVRAQRNQVRRTDEVYGFLERDGRSSQFAGLIEVSRPLFGNGANFRGEAEALVANNHGDGTRFDVDNASAVRVRDRAVGILGNHVRTDSGVAFRIDALVGLFTDNLSNTTNDVPSAIEEAPNRTNL